VDEFSIYFTSFLLIFGLFLIYIGRTVYPEDEDTVYGYIKKRNEEYWKNE
jgi:hypothetical protein